MMFLSRFKAVRPPHVVPQADSLAWLARAQARINGFPEDEATFHRRLSKFACGPGVIDRRASFLPDFTHDDSARMQIYSDRATGSVDRRQAFYREVIRRPVEEAVPAEGADFANWIHVSCTGYVSPSVVQEITSQRGWGARVETLHAYHMGCYAALPALRMARGLGATEITHTELCTLHLDVANTEPEQLVINSLFADGVISYRAGDQPESGYRVEATREVIAGESRDAMTWSVSAAGFRMTLSREVPKLVRQHVAGVVAPWREPGAVYAIHPGGPRIIDAVKEALALSEEQVTTSREILREYGNMSSATLPHVWMRMREQIPPGTPVISLAFGPGLTIAASLMRAT